MLVKSTGHTNDMNSDIARSIDLMNDAGCIYTPIGCLLLNEFSSVLRVKGRPNRLVLLSNRDGRVYKYRLLLNSDRSMVDSIPCGPDDTGVKFEEADVITVWKWTPSSEQIEKPTMTNVSGYMKPGVNFIKRPDSIHVEIIKRLNVNPIISLGGVKEHDLRGMGSSVVEVIKPPVGPRVMIVRISELEFALLSLGRSKDVIGRTMPWKELNGDVKASWIWTENEECGLVDEAPRKLDLFPELKQVPFSALIRRDIRENQGVYITRLTGDRFDTYDAVFESNKDYVDLKAYMDGRFLKAAYSVIDKQGMVHPGDKVDVSLTVVSGEYLISFAMNDNSVSHYRIDDTGRCTQVMTVLEFQTSESQHAFSVIMVTPFKTVDKEPTVTLGGHSLDNREKPVQDEPSHKWIPQINQFVKVVGRTEMWVIHDFDDFNNEFIIKLADKTRAKRAETMVKRPMASHETMADMAVKGSLLRPVVLSY